MNGAVHPAPAVPPTPPEPAAAIQPLTRHNPFVAIALAGPTASGKSAAALHLAHALADEWPVEIISVDSAQVYKGMDIGTAKPGAAERAATPHHLIDLIDPLEAYSAARFVREALACIRAVRARGALPLLVGGTMLYFKALQEGLHAMPESDPAVRAAIDARAKALGWPALHAELERVDPITAARLQPQDAQRIQRALEVWHSSGQPLSQFHAEGARALAGPPMALFALEPQSREWLHARIAERFDAMLAQGLVDEVRGLRARGDLHADLPSMRCVGYRQVWQALDALEAPARVEADNGGASTGGDSGAKAHMAGRGLTAHMPERGLTDHMTERGLTDHMTERGLTDHMTERGLTDHMRESGLAATRQLAKRQLTWLRAMPQRESIACDAAQPAAALLQGVRRVLSGPGDHPVAAAPGWQAPTGGPGAKV